jgi:predicted glycosyltransferase
LNSTWEQAKIVVIYALGGGWGHLNRALALARILGKRSQVKIIVNSPYAALIPSIQGCELYQISPDIGVMATCKEVKNVLLATSYNCLVIDTFPRGLGGELAEILPQLKQIPRVLIHRDINPRYIALKNLHSFVTDNFNLVIVPGEGNTPPLANLPQVKHTKPWLIRSADELPSINTARSHLRLKPQENYLKTVIVYAAGKRAELALYGKLTQILALSIPNIAVRCLAAECPKNCPPNLWIFHYPGIECLVAADVVVGSGGYNTVYECAALRIPLIAFAMPRRYDRQEVRLSNLNVQKVKTIEEATFAVCYYLNINNCDRQPNFINGAVEAADLIEQVYSTRP